jgi:hypothetical protein
VPYTARIRANPVYTHGTRVLTDAWSSGVPCEKTEVRDTTMKSSPPAQPMSRKLSALETLLTFGRLRSGLRTRPPVQLRARRHSRLVVGG